MEHKIDKFLSFLYGARRGICGKKPAVPVILKYADMWE